MPSHIVALQVSDRIQNINYFCKDDLLRIFGYLDSSEIAGTVYPVCKTWREVGRDPRLWKEMNIDILMYMLDISLERQIMQAVQNATLLEELHLSSTCDVSRILAFVGRFCPQLKILTLEECTVESDSFIETLVLGCPRIEKLTVLGTLLGSALNKFSELKRLISFEATKDNLWFDDTFLTRLSANSRRLEVIVLEYGEYYDDRHLVPCFTNLKAALKCVVMDASFCGSSTYEAIAKCKELENLDICNAVKLKNSDLKELQALTNIKQLSITKAKRVSSNAFCNFIANFRPTHLECVRFEDWPKIDHTIEELVASSSDTIFHTVKKIDLGGCKNVTDRLVELILKGNSFLENLKLSSITSLRGTAFNTSDTSIAPLLKNLDVSNCLQIPKSYLHTFGKNRHLGIGFPSHPDDPEFAKLRSLFNI